MQMPQRRLGRDGPLVGRGCLTGRFRSPDDLATNDWRLMNRRFQAENFARNLALVEIVKQVATDRGCTPAQVALAWLLARDPGVIPIPGSTRTARVEENAAAASMPLTAAETAALDAIAPAVAGARYPERGMKVVDS